MNSNFNVSFNSQAIRISEVLITSIYCFDSYFRSSCHSSPVRLLRINSDNQVFARNGCCSSCIIRSWSYSSRSEICSTIRDNDVIQDVINIIKRSSKIFIEGKFQHVWCNQRCAYQLCCFVICTFYADVCICNCCTVSIFNTRYFKNCIGSCRSFTNVVPAIFQFNNNDWQVISIKFDVRSFSFSAVKCLTIKFVVRKVKSRCSIYILIELNLEKVWCSRKSFRFCYINSRCYSFTWNSNCCSKLCIFIWSTSLVLYCTSLEDNRECSSWQVSTSTKVKFYNFVVSCFNLGSDIGLKYSIFKNLY